MTSLNVLRVTNLTRQVTAAHLREVFGHFGDVARVDLAVDATVGLSRGRPAFQRRNACQVSDNSDVDSR